MLWVKAFLGGKLLDAAAKGLFDLGGGDSSGPAGGIREHLGAASCVGANRYEIALYHEEQ